MPPCAALDRDIVQTDTEIGPRFVIEDVTRRVKKLVRRLGNRGPVTKQQVWEAKWATFGQEDSRAPRPMHRIPDLIENGIRSGWFNDGATLIDIGCGSGELAAMMSDRGFVATGIDFSPSAIARARTLHVADKQRDYLTFEVVDIVGEAVRLGAFENLIDRGCFHCLDASDHGAYGRNVAAMAAKGSRFLLMCGLGSVTAARREALVRESLAEFFRIETIHDGGAADGLSFWMVRR